jgi:uncharacterized protein YhbP (UPF0306 family)
MSYRVIVPDEADLSAELRLSIDDILGTGMLLALATVGSDGFPHANTAFFAHDDDLVVYFVSERSARHSTNLRRDPRVTASVFLDPPTYGEQLRGVQLAGEADQVSTVDTSTALATYQGKFPTFAVDAQARERFLQADGPSVLFRLRVDAVTVLDEPRFGRRRYIDGRVQR